jgi:hypothetical protein
MMERYLFEQPDGTDEVVGIYDIIIPPNFKKTKPQTIKIKRAISYYFKQGMFDKPITVITETNESGFNNKYILVDGYSRYIAASDWMDMRYVPVRYISIEEYCNNRNI